MDFAPAGFRSFWEIIGFYGPEAGTHRNQLGTDAIQSRIARNRRNAFRLYYKSGLRHMVPQHAQLCCTSPCVAGREIYLWFHTDHLYALGGFVCGPQLNFFPYVKFVELEHKSNRRLPYVYHMRIYTSIYTYVYTPLHGGKRIMMRNRDPQTSGLLYTCF